MVIRSHDPISPCREHRPLPVSHLSLTDRAVTGEPALQTERLLARRLTVGHIEELSETRRGAGRCNGSSYARSSASDPLDLGLCSPKAATGNTGRAQDAVAQEPTIDDGR